MPATAVRSAVEQMVRAGVASSKVWSKRLKEEKLVREMLEKAEGGDTSALLSLGYFYLNGRPGLQRDPKRAVDFFQRAHYLRGEPDCTHSLAKCYLIGDGVERNEAYGIHLMTRAADQGSELARFSLARFFAEGSHGMPKSAHEATHWYSIPFVLLFKNKFYIKIYIKYKNI